MVWNQHVSSNIDGKSFFLCVYLLMTWKTRFYMYSYSVYCVFIAAVPSDYIQIDILSYNEMKWSMVDHINKWTWWDSSHRNVTESIFGTENFSHNKLVFCRQASMHTSNNYSRTWTQLLEPLLTVVLWTMLMHWHWFLEKEVFAQRFSPNCQTRPRSQSGFPDWLRSMVGLSVQKMTGLALCSRIFLGQV